MHSEQMGPDKERGSGGRSATITVCAGGRPEPTIIRFIVHCFLKQKGRRMKTRWLAGLMLAVVPGLVAAPVRAEAPQATPRAYLGVGVAAPKDASQHGALVQEVTPDSPAAKAGFKNGDLITKLADQNVNDPKALADSVRTHKPGDKLSVHVMRDGKEQTLDVTLGERTAPVPPKARELLGNKHTAFLGVRTHDLTAEQKKRLDTTADKGAIVMEVMSDSPAAKAGLKTDDIITAVNGQAVANPDELASAIRKIGTGKEVTLKVMRGKESKEIKATLADMPFALSWFHGMEPRWEMTDKQFTLPSNIDPELKRHIEEMQKRLREFEEQLAPPAK
jgi:S1-C subfamily serine protease